MTPKPTAGRGWARFGFTVGVAASVAANVAHTYIAPLAADPATWAPPRGAVVAAAWWPLALVIAIEVISRVQWPKRWYWAVTRWGGLTAVAMIAAIISYRHLSGLMAFYGEDGLSATIGPLAVDGLMVVCSAALLAIGANVRAVTPAPAPATTSVTTPVVVPTPAAEPVTGDVPEVPAGGKPEGVQLSDVEAKEGAQSLRYMYPDMPEATIALRVGRSERQVRRYLSGMHSTVNGKRVAITSGAER